MSKQENIKIYIKTKRGWESKKGAELKTQVQTFVRLFIGR